MLRFGRSRPAPEVPKPSIDEAAPAGAKPCEAAATPAAPARPAPQPPSSPPKRPATRREDTDFLPAALEILETPPSPNRMAFLMAICGFVVVALAWSYVGRIDIIASARGKIQPAGRVKIIQPVETAKVVKVPVRNGQAVRQGELLLELDATDAQTDEAAALNGYLAYRAEAQRRLAVLRAAESPTFEIVPIEWPQDMPQANREREDRVLRGDIAQLAATVASFDAQMKQKEAELKRLKDMAETQKGLVAVLQQRVDMRKLLVEKGAGPIANLIDAQETLGYHATNYATTKGQLGETAAAMEVLQRDRAKAIDTFIADNRQKLADAERQMGDFEQKVAKARVHVEHLALRSPIDGTVAALTVTSAGQVVSVGEEVMRIVPSNVRLEIEAYLENKDVGFVKPGQEALVKIESFPFTRYGTISATVLRVSKDAIPEQDAQQIEGDPAKQSKSSGFAGAQRTQNLVFPVTLEPQEQWVDVEGQRVSLMPGMAVTVEIKTGSRRILEYLLSPLVETSSKALRER
jgi:hemolysin D